MVPQILLDGLVAQDETEAALRVHVDGPLQIELVEVDRMLDDFGAAFLDGFEVELGVHEPIIGNVIGGAIG